nr:MAG TPA: hypothetical protein [Caudoviricetes sp.]
MVRSGKACTEVGFGVAWQAKVRSGMACTVVWRGAARFGGAWLGLAGRG